MMFTRFGIAAFTALVLVCAPVQATATDITLERLEGGRESLANTIGQGEWVVVNVWSPTCQACVIELPQIRQFRREHPDIPFIGVTIDFPSFGYGKRGVTQAFLEDHPLDYPLYLADMEQASGLIDKRLVAIPLIAIFHPDGRPVARWPGEIKPGEIMDFINNFDDYQMNDNLTDGF